jgi:molybdate transport system substrate-binding protein
MTSQCIFYVLLILLTPQWVGAAERLLVGAAANYILPFKVLAAAFEKKTGIDVKLTFTSSGNLYSQIAAGAPYDLFLSADEQRPADLFRKNIAGEPFVYATGRLVLWSTQKDACRSKTWQGALKSNMKKIAIPNPEVSPYGAEAYNVIKGAGLWEPVKPQLVFAQDTSQSFQYAATGGVAMAFTSLSFTLSEQGKKGCYYTIEEAQPVRQAACILKKARNRDAAEVFSAFLLSPEAVEIRKKYGYE